MRRWLPPVLLACACVPATRTMGPRAPVDGGVADSGVEVSTDAGPAFVDAGGAPLDAGSADAGASTADAGATDAGHGDLIVFVSPTGAGSACTSARPCALETGRDLASTLIATAPADVIVSLAGGTYRLARTLALSNANSGAPGHTIHYQAAAGATPVLSGALQVTGFTQVGTTDVWVAHVPPGTASRQLYVNGKRATRARTPANPSGYTLTSTGFTLGDAAIASWPDSSQLEVVGTDYWRMFRCPVSSVTTSGIVVADPCWSNAQGSDGFSTLTWLENAVELIDSGGEWYLDEAGGQLSYEPLAGEDLATADVELPVLEQLVDAEGTPDDPIQDLSFEGITFAYATWLGPSSPSGYVPVQASISYQAGGLAKPLANVTLHATHDVTFTGCTFTHLGGAGLAFEVGAQSNTVDSSRFEDISASAIMIGDVTHSVDDHPTSPALDISANTVQDSFITRAGAEYWDACGLFIGYTTATTVTRNELFDLPYTGISVGWGWGSPDVGGADGDTTPTQSMMNTISNNLISYHMRSLFDGGAIYTLGSQQGSSISGNVISNQAAPYGNIYLDNGTQDYTVADNLVLLDPKEDTAVLNRSYWIYVQVGAPVASHNVIGLNYTNDPTLYTPQPIDPSNSFLSPDTNPADAASVVAAAGTSLRSPEIAGGMNVTASSVYDPGHPASDGNDGNGYDGWSPAGDDANPWWTVDLGASYAIDNVEIVTRWGIDQPVTRQNFRIVAATDAAFTAPIVLGSVGGTPLPYQAIYSADVVPPVTARYVKVEKTVSEYFFLGEVRVHGR